MARISPPELARELGELLRSLRRAQNLTMTQVAHRTGVSAAKLSRIETATFRPQRDVVEAVLAVYGADEETRRHCVALTDGALAEPWWAPYKAVLPGRFAALETAAVRICTWQPLLLPGLVQTPDYTRAVFAAAGSPPQVTELAVTARQMRQRVQLSGPDALRLRMVLWEPLLRRRILPSPLWAAQLSALAECASRPNLSVRVLPERPHGHPGLEGGFSVLELPHDRRVVHTEGGPAESIIDTIPSVAEFDRRYRWLEAHALPTGESAVLIAKIAREIRC
ncbi:helix-turn-helix domain-containing protein [Bailinhaonella thermotolerans]|nr:helix-turn-helix transcriptional regulator [Bailinhaonella thermotolerans]